MNEQDARVNNNATIDKFISVKIVVNLNQVIRYEYVLFNRMCYYNFLLAKSHWENLAIQPTDQLLK